MNKRFNKHFLLGLVAGALVLPPSSSFAQLPKGNTFVAVGLLNAGNERETLNYVDIASIRKKGNKSYYVQWAVWKYEQNAAYGSYK